MFPEPHRIENGNRAYYAHKGLMPPILNNTYTKRKICMTLVSPVVTYECET
jgi:hypothetical protein